MTRLVWRRLGGFSSVFLRLALGISFLSAVADRFGLWGAAGQPHVAWGNFARFVDYTAKLNWFAPPSMIVPLAILATAAEAILGILLVLGWQTRLTALLSGLLLATFAVVMTLSLGLKAPLDYSVFSAAGGALLLAAADSFPLSLDAWVGWIGGRARNRPVTPTRHSVEHSTRRTSLRSLES